MIMDEVQGWDAVRHPLLKDFQLAIRELKVEPSSVNMPLLEGHVSDAMAYAKEWASQFVVEYPDRTDDTWTVSSQQAELSVSGVGYSAIRADADHSELARYMRSKDAFDYATPTLSFGR